MLNYVIIHIQIYIAKILSPMLTKQTNKMNSKAEFECINNIEKVKKELGFGNIFTYNAF